ncbi:hypothetical protein [Metabacillus indicus]|uniref:hypothetical protein n=1 Tax=Metabacillus indicus TaxID=246786 RepID=UPI0004936E13|nr:hypothetical protein [Metabacillus indicus]KEZ50887.1 hypothetical protein AZ46_0209640 [Metabacillus indicus LMG 22858]
MELTIGAWFNEPKINFKFSHKVDNYIRIQIIEHIMKPLGLLDIEKDVFLHLTVATKKEQDRLEVFLPRKNNRAKSKNYGLWFPYIEIIHSDYPLKSYVEFFVQSLPIIFNEWGVKQEQIENVTQNVFNEILSNKFYELTAEELEELSFSERMLDGILEELGLDNDEE